MKLLHNFFSIIFFSCEKPVDIQLNSLSTQLVVEGLYSTRLSCICVSYKIRKLF